MQQQTWTLNHSSQQSPKDKSLILRHLRLETMSKSCEDPTEKLVIEKLDKNGERWVKKYVGGGLHFVNWLTQYKEIYGERNVAIEEVAAPDFSCYKQGKEKIFRIWVKEKK
jgi:hypothetical protein